jgi:hypothetical protein
MQIVLLENSCQLVCIFLSFHVVIKRNGSGNILNEAAAITAAAAVA